MKNRKKEIWCQACLAYLADENLWCFFEKCDADLAEGCRQEGCLVCGGRLHRANFKRKPRGGPAQVQEVVLRLSFCCDRDGCRKRHTPPSLRFLGRRVYRGVVVVLISAMCHTLGPAALRELCATLGIDRRTLRRWRQWWSESFVESRFWKKARAGFVPALCEATLPLSLCEAFQIGEGTERRDRLLELLKLLAPMTASSFLFETN